MIKDPIRCPNTKYCVAVPVSVTLNQQSKMKYVCRALLEVTVGLTDALCHKAVMPNPFSGLKKYVTRFQ